MKLRHIGVMVLAAGFVACSFSARGADAIGDPALARAQIQETSGKVLDLFRDRELFRPESTDRLLGRLHALLDERFDWSTIARWVLATNRPLFNDEQLGEFARRFSDYVVLYYLTQVEQHITGGEPGLVDQVRTEYRDGKRRADDSVSMEVVFTTPKGSQVLTGYTLVFDQAGGAWRVRNFSVEGVSLVRNWRTELAPVKSRDKIMELLGSKVTELRARRAAGAAKPSGVEP